MKILLIILVAFALSSAGDIVDSLVTHGPVVIHKIYFYDDGTLDVVFQVGNIPYMKTKKYFSGYNMGWDTRKFVGKTIPAHTDSVPETFIWKDLPK